MKSGDAAVYEDATHAISGHVYFSGDPDQDYVFFCHDHPTFLHGLHSPNMLDHKYSYVFVRGGYKKWISEMCAKPRDPS